MMVEMNSIYARNLLLETNLHQEQAFPFNIQSGTDSIHQDCQVKQFFNFFFQFMGVIIISNIVYK